MHLDIYGVLFGPSFWRLADLTGDGVVTDNSDLKLRRTPKWTFGLSGNYDIPVGPGFINLTLFWVPTRRFSAHVKEQDA